MVEGPNGGSMDTEQVLRDFAKDVCPCCAQCPLTVEPGSDECLATIEERLGDE